MLLDCTPYIFVNFLSSQVIGRHSYDWLIFADLPVIARDNQPIKLHNFFKTFIILILENEENFA